jgi:hypothetical protein
MVRSYKNRISSAIQWSHLGIRSFIYHLHRQPTSAIFVILLQAKPVAHWRLPRNWHIPATCQSWFRAARSGIRLQVLLVSYSVLIKSRAHYLFTWAAHLGQRDVVALQKLASPSREYTNTYAPNRSAAKYKAAGLHQARPAMYTHTRRAEYELCSCGLPKSGFLAGEYLAGGSPLACCVCMWVMKAALLE